MAVFYAGTDREIHVGDMIIGCGSCDGWRVEGRVGRVTHIRENQVRGYVICAEFSEDCENRHWWLRPDNFIPADGDYTPDTMRRCHRCSATLPDAPSVLGSRLYKRGGLCDNCIAREIAQMHGYHFAKNLKYNITQNKITLGAEVEIDAPSNDDVDTEGFIKDCVQYARDNNYPLVMSYERDGSLNEGGVECVTVPLTLAEWKMPEVSAQYERLFDLACDYGFNFKKKNHAGLHIHIGRKDLCGAEKEISDAVGLLMGWACTRLWNDGLSRLAGRGENDYCHALDRTDGGEPCGKGLKDTPAMWDRYSFVNIQNNATLELRIFNRAECYEDVLVAVDTCYMLAKWATKKINAYLKRNTYSAKAREFTDALAYADRVSWAALVKYSKFPEVTLPRMKSAGIII